MTYHTGLSRDGPALLVRDLLKNEADADLQQIVAHKPDVVALQNVDFDHDQIAVGLIQDRLRALGHDMPNAFTARPNTGIDSGFDLDKNGRLSEPRDMLGYGRFSGQGGMVVLSKFPVLVDQSKDLSGVLWRDQMDAGLPDGGYFSAQLLEVLPLHSVAAWDLSLQTPKGVLRILTSHASTPVFDGPEDRNGLRNAAELRFWQRYIEQPDVRGARFVLLGTLNNDPEGGEGRKPPLHNLINHPNLQDPKPTNQGRPETATWSSGLSLRVDYVLPSRRLGVGAAKIERPAQGTTGSAHYPVWVDVIWQ